MRQNKQYVEDLNKNQEFQRSLIKKGRVKDCLKEATEAIGAVEIGMELELDVFLIRQELGRLLEQGEIEVRQVPYQSRVNSGGLVYQISNKKNAT